MGLSLSPQIARQELCTSVKPHSITLQRERGETNLALSQSVKDSLLNLIRMLIQVHMLQHHDTTQQQRRGVRETLAGDIGRGTVHGLKDGALVADVARGGQTQPTNQAGAHIGQNVAVQVGHHEDFVVVRDRIRDDLQAGVVEQLGVEIDVRVAFADIPSTAQEETVGHFHDRGFVHDAHLSSSDVFGVLEGKFEDALGGCSGDELDALDDAIDDHVFDAGVFAFGVFTDKNGVDVVVGGFVAGY